MSHTGVECLSWFFFYPRDYNFSSGVTVGYLILLSLSCFILQATRPVQDYLSMPYDAIKEEHQKAQHLPVPLYILYMQTSAYKDACGECDPEKKYSKLKE